MSDIKVRPILEEMGTDSVAELFRRTGSPLTSLAKQSQLAAIGMHYQKCGGAGSTLGLPLTEAEFNQDGARRNFAGGRIEFLDNTPTGYSDTVVQVTFVGWHCNAESNELSGSDEPYFLIGVASTNGSRTMKFGPYEDVDAGSNQSEASEIVGVDDRLTPPIVLGVAGMEHDEGSPEEAEAKVRAIFEEIESKIEAAGREFGIFTGSNHVMPEWMRDIVIGWVPEGVAALLGLGDDHIKNVSKILFDYDPALAEWTPIPELGSHEGNPYNLVIRVNQENADEGDYSLFFNVRVVKVDWQYVLPSH
ncbi:hypothetical protein ACFVFJ_45755 [Streptomyces sp. NPDC057717]|uniref:hypothetical protein n=1 Tax=Streptomyces sp. NPDC057717 TaxID=3346224 RepID=UPI0036B6214E